MRLATPRLGDGGTRAIFELVGGSNDKVKRAASKPAFESESNENVPAEEAAAT
jgi:large subunit ribosomal protein L17